jgi:ubiquinone/menaquinone biosynthesis C-methylase UbiE
MALGRRAARLEDASAWVFNAMAEVYDARPAYPEALVDALSQLAREAPSHVGGHVLDLGAGTGQLALPLAQRGHAVTAIEPALGMLEQLRMKAMERGLVLRAEHATAEALPHDLPHVHLALIADALHFIDVELCAVQLTRVLGPKSRLALLTTELSPTPFMRALVGVMEQAAPRRPRDTRAHAAQLASLTDIALDAPRVFHDETPVTEALLERILRSISFIGPAMNAARFAAFFEQVLALPYPRVWARTFTLRSGKKRRR